MFHGVSKNRGTPKSSILIGVPLIFTIHFGGEIPLFLVQHPTGVMIPTGRKPKTRCQFFPSFPLCRIFSSSCLRAWSTYTRRWWCTGTDPTYPKRAQSKELSDTVIFNLMLFDVICGSQSNSNHFLPSTWRAFVHFYLPISVI